MLKPKGKILPPVIPSIGIEMLYRRRLYRLVDAMDKSVQYWTMAAYRQNEPLIAQDATTPASQLRFEIRRLARLWQKRFDQAAPKLADYFATDVHDRVDARLKKILKDAGISVEFSITPVVRDLLKASINQNVSLIKSIPSQYFTQIEGMVMRSVQKGGDMATLAKSLQHQYGVTRRRAALISRDQNSKATMAITRARQLESGMSKAVWVHSGGGNEPRPTHVRAGRDRTVYDVAEGWFDPHEQKYIFPGELINCRCISRPIIPGLT